MAVFDKILFPVEGPFGQPGWGFEDDALCLEMDLLGWTNQVIHGATYLHRHAHASIRECVKQQFDVRANYKERQDWFCDKYGAYPQYKDKIAAYRQFVIPEPHFYEHAAKPQRGRKR